MLNIFYDRTGDYNNIESCERIPNGIPEKFVEYYWPRFDQPKFQAHFNMEPAVYPSDLYRDDLRDFANICLVSEIEEYKPFKDTSGCLGIYPIEVFGAPDRSVGVDKVWKSIGKINFQITKSERKNLKFRRSIYVAKNIQKGGKLTKDNIRIIRPGYGIKTKYYDNIIGKKVTKKISKGTALRFSYFK